LPRPFFLFGIALVYGATGTTALNAMSVPGPESGLLKLGLALILIGLASKSPPIPSGVDSDVYEGAPTPSRLSSPPDQKQRVRLCSSASFDGPRRDSLLVLGILVIAAVTMFSATSARWCKPTSSACWPTAHRPRGNILVAFAAVTSHGRGKVF